MNGRSRNRLKILETSCLHWLSAFGQQFPVVDLTATSDHGLAGNLAGCAKLSKLSHSNKLIVTLSFSNNVFSTERLSGIRSLWPYIFGVPCFCFRCSLFHTVWAETFELLLCDCFCSSFTHSRITFYVYELCWGITYSIIQIGLCHAAMSDGLPLKPRVLLSWIFFRSGVSMCICSCGISFIKLIRLSLRVIVELDADNPPCAIFPTSKTNQNNTSTPLPSNSHAHSMISLKQEEFASQIKQGRGKREQYWPCA